MVLTLVTDTALLLSDGCRILLPISTCCTFRLSCVRPEERWGCTSLPTHTQSTSRMSHGRFIRNRSSSSSLVLTSVSLSYFAVVYTRTQQWQLSNGVFSNAQLFIFSNVPYIECTHRWIYQSRIILSYPTWATLDLETACRRPKYCVHY